MPKTIVQTGQVASSNFTKIGDGTPGNKVLYVNNGDESQAAVRYNDTTNEWEYSNDGITWTEFGVDDDGPAPLPGATENRPGVIEIATLEEVAAGTDADKAITPAALQTKLMSVAAPPVMAIADENMAAGCIVCLYSAEGVIHAKKAVATSKYTAASGATIAAVTAGSIATIRLSGIVVGSGLATGSVYYLSADVLGGISLTPPSAAGTIMQKLGMAVSATQLCLNIEEAAEVM